MRTSSEAEQKSLNDRLACISVEQSKAKSAAATIDQLQQAFDCKLIVFDSSNPLWKIQLWKKDCDSLHLRFHSTSENGAFVMDL